VIRNPRIRPQATWAWSLEPFAQRWIETRGGLPCEDKPMKTGFAIAALAILGGGIAWSGATLAAEDQGNVVSAQYRQWNSDDDDEDNYRDRREYRRYRDDDSRRSDERNYRRRFRDRDDGCRTVYVRRWTEYGWQRQRVTRCD